MLLAATVALLFARLQVTQQLNHGRESEHLFWLHRMDSASPVNRSAHLMLRVAPSTSVSAGERAEYIEIYLKNRKYMKIIKSLKG